MLYLIVYSRDSDASDVPPSVIARYSLHPIMADKDPTMNVSWPALCLPPTSLFQHRKVVDGRHKAGQDTRSSGSKRLFLGETEADPARSRP